MQDVEAIYASRLKEAREAAGLSQARLAAVLAEVTDVNLDPTAITRLERGQRGIGLREAYALAQVLGVSLEDLCTPRFASRSTELKLAVHSARRRAAEAAAIANHAAARAEETHADLAIAEAELKSLLAALAAALVEEQDAQAAAPPPRSTPSTARHAPPTIYQPPDTSHTRKGGDA